MAGIISMFLVIIIIIIIAATSNQIHNDPNDSGPDAPVNPPHPHPNIPYHANPYKIDNTTLTTTIYSFSGVVNFDVS